MPEPSIKATTTAATVDLVIEISPLEPIGLYGCNCVETVEAGKGAVNNPPLWRAGHACDTCGHGSPHDQARRRGRRSRAYEKGSGRPKEAAAPEARLTSLGLHPKYAQACGGAPRRRVALLGGARRHTLPPNPGRLRRGFRQGRGPEILQDQGQAHDHPDRAAGLPRVPGVALFRGR